MKITGLAGKFIPLLRALITEIANISWVGLIAMLAVSGLLWMFGNEYSAKKLLRNAIYGFMIIQIANSLL